MWLLILAQAAGAPDATNLPGVNTVRPWWQVLLDNGLALTVLFIFLSAIVGVVLKVRRKDKCLKFLNDYHVSYLTTGGRALWGDLTVYSQGIELRFDAPYTTRHGLIKTSALIYPEELDKCLALCRTEGSLTAQEIAARKRQVRRSFNPGLVRRGLRWCRNLINTLRDAFSKAMTAIIGTLLKSRAPATVQQQQGSVDSIGQTILGAAGNAYEPMLEAHIGKPVILRTVRKAEDREYVLELPGYLVDYTEQWVAVFNVEHGGGRVIEHAITESQQHDGYSLALDGDDVKITCLGPDVLIVEEFAGGSRRNQLALPLIPGTHVTLRREPGAAVTLKLRLTRQVDMVCPRKVATIHFASDHPDRTRDNWRGMAPEQDAEKSASVAEDDGNDTLFEKA